MDRRNGFVPSGFSVYRDFNHDTQRAREAGAAGI